MALARAVEEARRKSFYFNDNTESTHSGRLSLTIVHHFRISFLSCFVCIRVYSGSDTGVQRARYDVVKSKMRCICHYNCRSETESRCVTAFIAREIFSDGIFSHLNRNRREKNWAKLHTEITIVIQSLNGIQWIERNKHCSAQAYSAFAPLKRQASQFPQYDDMDCNAGAHCLMNDIVRRRDASAMTSTAP